MPIDVLKPDLTPLEDFAITGLEAGQDSDVVPFALRNASGQDLFDLLLIFQVEHPTQAGLFVSAGFPPQDELWGRVRLTGQNNAGAPAQQLLRTDWTPVGAYAALLIRDVLAGGIRLGEIKMHPPSNAQVKFWRWSLSVIELEHARAVPPALTATRRGVLTHVGDRAHSGLVEGCGVTVSAPADDEIHVAAGFYVHRGRYLAHLVSNHALDQNDGNAAALAAGEAYWAALSLGAAGVVITKGVKAVNPAKPAPPETNAPLGHVKVLYGAGGSVIEAAHLELDLVYHRYLAVAGAGLQLVLHAGQALAASTWRYHASRQVLALADNVTNYLWQVASGEPDLTIAPDPPDSTALLLWEADTAAGAITALRDRRTYAEETIVLHLRGDLPGAAGDITSQLVQHEALAIERIVYRLSDNGGGGSGQTILDLEINGATVYTSQATDDQRPAWAFNAANLIDVDGVHELVELRRGDVLTLLSAQHPVGGTPAWAEAYLICRRSL